MADQNKHDDMHRNEDPESVGGAVGGATGAAAAGAAGLALLGPIGGVIGLLAGAAGGWWGGQGITRAIQDVDRADNEFRRAHEHAGAQTPFDEARHSYRLGYIAGQNPEYANAPFTQVEDDLRTAWNNAHIHDHVPVGWDEVRENVRAGYELARE